MYRRLLPLCLLLALAGCSSSHDAAPMAPVSKEELAPASTAPATAASAAHAKANMVRFNFFKQQGAFSRDEKTGRYRVDFDKMTAAMNALSAKLLTIQGDGDYTAAKQLTDQMGVVDAQLAGDLKHLDLAHIPVDIRFEQGLGVLGLADPAAAK